MFTNPQFDFGGIQPAPILVWNFLTATAGTLPSWLTLTRTTSATYFNSSGVLSTASSGVARTLDYDPRTLAPKGFLLEELRANLLLYSNAPLGNWSPSGITCTANATTSPDNTSNANHLQDFDTSNAVHTFFKSVSVASGSITGTAFFKAAEYSYGAICLVDSSGNRYGVVASLPSNGTGVVTATNNVNSPTGTSSSVAYVGNGWYRIVATMATGSGTGYLLISSSPTASPSFSTGVPIYVGTANSGTYFYGGQVEAGTFATSYIATTSATVTRNADVVTIGSPFSTLIGGSSGSVILQAIAENPSAPAAITNLIRGTNSILYHDTTGKVGTTNGTNILLGGAAATWTSPTRSGLAWSSGGRSLAYTGASSVATDANTVSNGGTLYLGSNNGSAVESGWYQSIAGYNQRNSDAALKAKMTIGSAY